MKQSIKLVATCIFFSVILNTQSFAQGMVAVQVQSGSSSPSFGETSGKEIIAKGSFSSLFPKATMQKWTGTAENSFVSFLNSGRKARASFNEKGAINYVITNCSMEDLPADFSKSIKTNYAAYQIFNAIEIKAYGETAYQAIMENETGFRTLKYTIDGVEEIRLVKK